MSDNYKVKRVSEETRMNIQRKSAYTLPNRPTEQGMKPNELKRAFYGFVTEANNSMISEMNRVVDEANKALDEEEKGRTAHENDKNNPHQVTKAQVGLGNADNTKDSEKEVSIPQQVALNNHNLNEAAHQDIRKSIEEEEQSRIKSLDEHNKDTTAHEDIRAAVKKAYDNHTEELAAHNLSDKAHQDIRDEVAKKANTADIQDNLSSTAKNKPLSANQGKVLDGKISSLSSKVTNETLKDVSWDSVNYKLSITKNDGTKVEIDLPMESVVKNGRYDTSTKKIILTLVNNTEISFDASALVNIYQADGTTLVLNGNVFKLSDTILDRLVAVEKEPGCLPVFMDIPFEAPESLTDIAQSYGDKILKTRNTTVGNLCVCRFGTPNSKGQELAIGEITQVVNEDVNGYVDIYVLCIDFLDGENGKIPYVGENGNWWVDGEDTGTKAQGKTGEMALACVSKVTLPENVSMCDMTITLDNFNRTPVAGEKFFINGRNAGGSNSYIAIGTIESVTDNGAEVHIEDIVSTKGARGISGTDGVHCEHSWNGTTLNITSKSGTSSQDLRGPQGVTPHIGSNNNWYIGEIDTGICAKATDGTTPHIGDNGNWFVGTIDTGVAAQGPEGPSYTLPIASSSTLGGVKISSTTGGLGTGITRTSGGFIYAQHGVYHYYKKYTPPFQKNTNVTLSTIMTNMGISAQDLHNAYLDVVFTVTNTTIFNSNESLLFGTTNTDNEIITNILSSTNNTATAGSSSLNGTPWKWQCRSGTFRPPISAFPLRFTIDGDSTSSNILFRVTSDNDGDYPYTRSWLSKAESPDNLAFRSSYAGLMISIVIYKKFGF